MATKMPRLNVVLEEPVYFTIVKMAKREGISLSTKARDLIKQALEYCEDAYWTGQVKTVIRRLVTKRR
jgi:hypothetical protein